MIFDRVDSIWPDPDEDIMKDKLSSTFFLLQCAAFCMHGAAGVVVQARPVLGSPWHRTNRIIMQLMASLEDPA